MNSDPSLPEPIWTPWATARPQAAGLYWWRLPEREWGGMRLRPEWIDEARERGMGYGPRELWPRMSHWDGYQCHLPQGLEWTPAPEAGAKQGDNRVALPGIAGCPFCGRVPALGMKQYTGDGVAMYSAPFYPNRFWIACSCGQARTAVYDRVQPVLDRWGQRAPALAA